MLESAVPILASLNAEETIKFYTDKLGFTLNNNWDWYVILSRDEITMHLWPCKDPEIPKATGCYINVNEVEKLYDEYKQTGVVHPNGPLKEMPWKMKQFSILDNNGNIIHFGEEMKD